MMVGMGVSSAVEKQQHFNEKQQQRYISAVFNLKKTGNFEVFYLKINIVSIAQQYRRRTLRRIRYFSPALLMTGNTTRYAGFNYFTEHTLARWEYFYA